VYTWRAIVFTLLLVGCANAPEEKLRPGLNYCSPREEVLQELRDLGYPAGSFCAATSSIEADPFIKDKDFYMDEQRWLNSDPIAVELAHAYCAREAGGYFPNDEQALAMCEFFAIENYRRLNRALMEQVDSTCATLADHYCIGVPVNTGAVTRACIERNEPVRLKALMYNQLTMPHIQ
jgi:hypothetical protein